MLKADKYYDIIKHTSLTSIDIYFVKDNKFIIGKRNNNPAKGFLFTPGCRTYKNETQTEGLVRVAKTELGIDINPDNCKMIGVYDHMYNNNFLNNLTSTHYVDVAYVYNISDEEIKNINVDDQHEKLFMVVIDEALNKNSEIHNKIHSYVINTLIDLKKMGNIIIS